jgi:hypothetical protein
MRDLFAELTDSELEEQIAFYEDRRDSTVGNESYHSTIHLSGACVEQDRRSAK